MHPILYLRYVCMSRFCHSVTLTHLVGMRIGIGMRKGGKEIISATICAEYTKETL